MSDSVHAFCAKIRASGSAPGGSTVALLYYSGHGLQVSGENYLVPIGFKMPASDRDMVRFALSAQSALDEMKDAHEQVNIAILDACRSNPFAKDRDLGGKGFTELRAQGMLIAYATEAGKTASDNTNGANGLYTSALLPLLRKPGLPLNKMFSQTRDAVYEASDSKQFPYVYDGLIHAEDFCLVPGVAAPAAPPAPVMEAANASVLDTKARLSVSVNAPGAVVAIDGVSVAGGVFSANLLDEKARTVRVKVTAAGYEGQMLTVKLLPGKSLTLPVELVAMAAPAPLPPAVVDAAASVMDSAASRRFVPPLTLAAYKAQMVLIPAGAFTMGSDEFEDAKPVHKVMLSAYRIGKTAVTVGMYEEFCKSTKRKMPPEPNAWGNHFNAGWSKKDHPIVKVSWEDAKAYCDWAGLALPTEAQWEKAARGADGRDYPWGKDYDTEKVWHGKGKEVGDAGGTRAVGNFPAGTSPYGCLDMAGNVWQWCADWYDESFYASRRAEGSDPLNNSPGLKRAIRGGSWISTWYGDFRCAHRDWRWRSESGMDDEGFRAALPVR